MKCDGFAKDGKPCRYNALHEFGPFESPVRLCRFHEGDRKDPARSLTKDPAPDDFPEIHHKIAEVDYWINALYSAAVENKVMFDIEPCGHGQAARRALAAKRDFLRALLEHKRTSRDLEDARDFYQKAKGDLFLWS